MNKIISKSKKINRIIKRAREFFLEFFIKFYCRRTEKNSREIYRRYQNDRRTKCFDIEVGTRFACCKFTGSTSTITKRIRSIVPSLLIEII